jgi:hypothetical protein
MGARPKTWLARMDGHRPIFGTKHHTGWPVLGGVGADWNGGFLLLRSLRVGMPGTAAHHCSPLTACTLSYPGPRCNLSDCFSEENGLQPSAILNVLCSNTCIGAASPALTMVVSRSRSLPLCLPTPLSARGYSDGTICMRASLLGLLLSVLLCHRRTHLHSSVPQGTTPCRTTK